MNCGMGESAGEKMSGLLILNQSHAYAKEKQLVKSRFASDNSGRTECGRRRDLPWQIRPSRHSAQKPERISLQGDHRAASSKSQGVEPAGDQSRDRGTLIYERTPRGRDRKKSSAALKETRWEREQDLARGREWRGGGRKKQERQTRGRSRCRSLRFTTIFRKKNARGYEGEKRDVRDQHGVDPRRRFKREVKGTSKGC